MPHGTPNLLGSLSALRPTLQTACGGQPFLDAPHLLGRQLPLAIKAHLTGQLAQSADLVNPTQPNPPYKRQQAPGKLLVMNSAISKPQARPSRVNRSKAYQDALLNAVADIGAGLPQTRRPLDEALAGDLTTVSTTKRKLDSASGDPLPVKRARLEQTEAQPEIEDGEADQAAKTTLQHPKPTTPDRQYPSFLKDYVDPPPSESVRTTVLEWLASVVPERCRSASYLERSDNDPVSRQLTRSAPQMGPTRDADGFVVPPTPASTGSRSYRATEDSASSTASVRRPSYRRNNLNANKIYIRDADTPLPAYVSSKVETIRADRDSPDPPSEQVRKHLHALEILARGCNEADVEKFLENAVFPPDSDLAYGRSAGLESAKSSLMSSHLVPNNSESQFRVPLPKPDLLYGYSGDCLDKAFTESQFLAQEILHPQNPRFAEATAQGLRFPFFAIEFKAAGGTRGDLWVATNQCAGALAACVTAVDQLNISLRKYCAPSVDNLSYAIAMDNVVAQLYVSWKEGDLNYFVQRVDDFLLSRPEDFKRLRSQVRNILDWGKDARLKQIGNALDIILEESRKTASEVVKSRPPPSSGPVVGGLKRNKQQ